MLRAKKGAPENQAELVSELIHEKTSRALDQQDKTILDYVLKLTRTPYLMTANDVDRLKAQGFNDRAIHDICAITAYFAFVNRIAAGLGVELEDRFTK